MVVEVVEFEADIFAAVVSGSSERVLWVLACLANERRGFEQGVGLDDEIHGD